MAATRPTFSPEPCLTDDFYKPLQFNDGTNCIPVCFCAVTFPLELFEVAALQLVEHPEYNSTLILRSETLSECHLDSDKPSEIPHIEGYRFLKNTSRKLLPRRPGRDLPIDQHCSFYTISDTSETDDVPAASCVVLTPVINPEESMPYYHPTVSHLAFRYLQSRPKPFLSVDGDDDSFRQIRIEVVPLPHSSDPKDVNSRLYRTCLALLETIHRYGWGAMTNYKKRVIHDYIIPRDVYQDLYLVMRERHKHIVQEWKEETDPLKHVFEDIGIATFLILLWKDMFQCDHVIDQDVVNPDTPPWVTWPRPQGGFLDLGCGNGLLTHILISEGYAGEGIDVRARTSWASYASTTQEHLHTYSLDPTSVLNSKDNSAYSTAVNNDYFKAGVFIIANHADELTPWTPILSTLCSASGYLSIPCCAWSFDTKFERSSNQLLFSSSRASSNGNSPEFIDSLNLGGDGSNSSTYALYRIWLASLSLYCGWEVECETLRIPSTRNWALIGRKRSQNKDDSIRNCIEIVAKVQERGIFKPRRPEGKAGDH